MAEPSSAAALRQWLLVVACLLSLVFLTSCSRPSPQAEVLKEHTENIEKTIAVLKSIKSVDDARAAYSQLEVLKQRGLDIQERENALIGKKVPLESRDYTREKLEENEAAFRQLLIEGDRLRQRNPEAFVLIYPIIR